MRGGTALWPCAVALLVAVAPAHADPPFEVQSLDGSGNNQANPEWGQTGRDYSRVAEPNYADGISEPVSGPNSRYVSNRVFNDSHQNLFSERSVTQWGFAWGQFLDHTFGLRLGAEPIDPPGEDAPIPFDPDDPIEEFENDLGVIPFTRSTASPGTGVDTPQEQVNTLSSYIDNFAVYGGTDDRLDWLREGAVDGDPGNNSAFLLLSDGYLPRAEDRGDPDSAPFMEAGGRLIGMEERAMVAGDVRANENIALGATHTLFAREHNRIVSELPQGLDEETKFQIARRVVIAEQQYITFNEFLPALGVALPAYDGYDASRNTDLSNEFATVGYRAHSMIHGEIELETDLDRYTQQQLDEFEQMGIEVIIEGDEVELVIALNLAFFNPDLIEALQLGALLQGLGLEPQYKNDDQIDNQLRSVLFQIPVEGNEDCLDGPDLPECFDGVIDLGAIDIERGRDHGMPYYNDLREAYGLARKTSFTAITGEDTEELPPDLTIDDPEILEFVELFDLDGNPIDLEDEDAVDGDAVAGIRASTLAGRLKAIFGSVDQLDAFTGMLAEQHLPGTDFGELQLAVWTAEFHNLRDGDRFFYGNQRSELGLIRLFYGIDYRRTLAQVIADNTDIPLSELNDNVFLAATEPGDTDCHVRYDTFFQLPGFFLGKLKITNTSDTPIEGWELVWRFMTGQQLDQGYNGDFDQQGTTVTVANKPWNGDLAPGESAQAFFLAEWDKATNAEPTHFTLNGGRCTRE